eukprot:s2258_g1.t1
MDAVSPSQSFCSAQATVLDLRQVQRATESEERSRQGFVEQRASRGTTYGAGLQLPPALSGSHPGHSSDGVLGLSGGQHFCPSSCRGILDKKKQTSHFVQCCLHSQQHRAEDLQDVTMSDGHVTVGQCIEGLPIGVFVWELLLCAFLASFWLGALNEP